MPDRLLRLGARFTAQAASLRKHDEGLCRDVLRAVKLLEATPQRSDDVLAIMPPDATPWLVRRVSGRNVWIWFRVSDDALFVARLSVVPPAPVDGGSG